MGGDHSPLIVVNLTGGTFDLAGRNEGFDGLSGSGGSVTNSAAATTSTLTLGQNNSAGSPVYSGAIQDGAGTVALAKTGSGTQTLAGTNTYSGATLVNGGTLNVTGSIGYSDVVVSNSGTVISSGVTGTLGSNLAVNSGATLSPGGAGASGTATVVNTTTVNSGSIFSWDISGDGSSYDKFITADLTGGGAVFRIVAGDESFSDTFWSQSRSWTNVFTSDGTNPLLEWSNLFSVLVVNSSFQPITPTNGSFGLSGSAVTWSAVPEVSNVLIGGLLGVGLLRRRRCLGAPARAGDVP